MLSLKNKVIENVVIIGGGRWARVIIEVLCDILNPSSNILIYSPHNYLLMNEWILENKAEKRIKILRRFPISFPTHQKVIIANAAKDHYKSALMAIRSGAEVLVEKPVALNYKQAEEIYNFAKKNNKIVCASHVFLFASYIKNFHNLIKDSGKIEKIRILWEDPVIERRHGELKKFDDGLPVIADCLPHALSIISMFAPINISYKIIKLQIHNGGSKVNINIESSGIPIEICLIRNGSQRTRIVEILVEEKKNTLDFSTEPGIIKLGNKKISGDLNWDHEPKPLKQLLSSFLSGANDKQFDRRLDFKFGVQFSKLIDDLLRIYKKSQLKWIINSIESENVLNQDLVYAINELNISNGLKLNSNMNDLNLDNEIKTSLLKIFNKLLIYNKT
jgi:hypothetical protein